MSDVGVNRAKYAETEAVPKPVQDASQFGEHAVITTKSAINRYNELVSKLPPEMQSRYPNPKNMSYEEFCSSSGQLAAHTRKNYGDNSVMTSLGDGLMMDLSCASRLKKY